MRLSTIILPIYTWREGRSVWRRAEQLGFHAAYTYDHLSWRTFRDEPWFGTMPMLTAAATATESIPARHHGYQSELPSSTHFGQRSDDTR